MQNEYIMTSIEIDEQFVDNASDNYMTDEERNYWIDLEEGATDEEIDEASYQMSDEEQKGLEQYLDDAREDVPECTDALVNLLFNAFGCDFDEKDRVQRELERRETREQERLERREAIRCAKANQRLLDRNPYVKPVIDETTIENLNNHFNSNA